MNISKPATSVLRHLEIEAQFDSHATTLVAAAQAGLFVHHASNISESGSPLEQAVINLFLHSFPQTFDVCAGYFFDSNLALSNQCDLLLCDQSEILRLPPTYGLVQKYVPFNCVRVMGQVKNSFSQLADAMEQSTKSIEAWHMMAEDPDHEWEDGVIYEPIAIVIIGKGGDEAKARKVLEAARSPRPAYVLLVEPGILYASDDAIRQVVPSKNLFQAGQGNDKPLVLLESNGTTTAFRGRFLMRLFFAVVRHAAGKNTKAFNGLVDKIESAYPLAYSKSPVIPLKR